MHHPRPAQGRHALKERFIYAQAPVDTRTENQQLQAFLDWTSAHAATGQRAHPVRDLVDSHSPMDAREQALLACTLWLWLDLRFPGAYGHAESKLALYSLLNDRIER